MLPQVTHQALHAEAIEHHTVIKKTDMTLSDITDQHKSIHCIFDKTPAFLNWTYKHSWQISVWIAESFCIRQEWMYPAESGIIKYNHFYITICTKHWPKMSDGWKRILTNKRTTESSDIVEKVISFSSVLEVTETNATWFDEFTTPWSPTNKVITDKL